MRFINPDKILAAQLTSPADNPLVTDESRMIEVWFKGAAVMRQMFKKVRKAEQEAFVEILLKRGFARSGRILIDPAEILFAEMENQLLGGVVTAGFQADGKPVEFKLSGPDFEQLCAGPAGSAT